MNSNRRSENSELILAGLRNSQDGKIESKKREQEASSSSAVALWGMIAVDLMSNYESCQPCFLPGDEGI